MKFPPPLLFFHCNLQDCLEKLILMPDWFMGVSRKRTVSAPRPPFQGWGMHRGKQCTLEKPNEY